ncbi:Aste57867_19564 [Aphanomyces stellatus]|uniref:Aste57867_17837 protein n=1 Tax=Aphanomyces stellatus TaxID=120398 RepID=A0A485KIK1_9STRA|nr:hypothetical protein As57867_019500 [Aphanomyces stellatus]KAF0690812.1 hypothetical protein As57867_017776 [Aphanomyces stellatus]KAF0703646.1 hypothetical protein As57867_007556 [Aphanomyces stellatus]VFT84491.1 Aste57867_7583 [Aphanomyces stellatus]VFT94580.1 Aste57867_17837 [Aphanomyces stellatus]
MYMNYVFVLDATTSAPRAPSTSHLRSTSAPTAAPALPTPWHDGTTIVVAVVAAAAVLVVGLVLLWRCCRAPNEKTMRTASIAVAASGGRESTDSDQTEPSWIVAFDQQLIEDDANERAAAKLAASESVWREIGTPMPNKCGKCGRIDSDALFVDATFFGMRCLDCYGLVDSPLPVEDYIVF